MKRLFITVALSYVCITCICQQKEKEKPKEKAKQKQEISFRDLKNPSAPKFAFDVFGSIDESDAHKLDALNIKDFGGAMPNGQRVQPDAKVSGNEDTARGTNIAPAISAAIMAATRGQFVIIGPGEW